MKKPQLFLMHFAGGNCYSYQSIINLLKEFDVISLELPGRGKRVKESLLTNFDLAAQDFYSQIVNRLSNAPFFIYGHSMGAYLTLKVGQMLENESKFPSQLFVSGNAGPKSGVNKKRYMLPDKDFIEEIMVLGGLPEELV